MFGLKRADLWKQSDVKTQHAAAGLLFTGCPPAVVEKRALQAPAVMIVE